MYIEDERAHLDMLRKQCGMSGVLDNLSYTERLYGSNSYESLVLSETNPLFLQLMHNRLIIGALRYDRIYAAGKPIYARLPRMLEYIEDYKKSGNQENLVDLANLALLEFTSPSISNVHFTAIDDGKHTQIA